MYKTGPSSTVLSIPSIIQHRLHGVETTSLSSFPSFLDISLVAKMTAHDNVSAHQEPTRPNSSSGSDMKAEARGIEEARGENYEYVDKQTERAILRKLDYRIIPMVMWVYLMNMMDRGMPIYSALK